MADLAASPGHQAASFGTQGQCDKAVQVEAEEVGLDPTRYKSVLCRNWLDTKPCPYSKRCVYAHGPSELRSVQQNVVSIGHITQGKRAPKDEEAAQGKGA